MSILVLGGAGYIGSHVVRELADQGRDVVVVDNLVTGHARAVDSRARFYHADIRDRSALDNVFEREAIDGVIHFAAFSLVGESMSAPLNYWENNVSGTTVVLRSMLAHRVDKIVFSSTAATYGEPERVPILESDPTNPTNCYGDTKLTMEKIMHWVGLAHGLKSVALRYFNAAGAHESGQIGEAHIPETHLVPLILQVANGQRPAIKLFGEDYPTADGTCIRDYVYVSDLARAHIQAIDYLIGGGESEILNLGSGQGFSVHQMIGVARRVTGHPIPVEVCARRAGDPARLVASSDKAREILGWKPKFDDVEAIVSSAWKWHREHPDGYGDR